MCSRRTITGVRACPRNSINYYYSIKYFIIISSRRAGQSLLFFGLGSKRALLTALGEDWTSDGACFSVNGLEPSLSAVQVLVWAAALSRGSKPALYRSYRADDLLELIGRPGGQRVYVLVHNIDGPSLRSAAAQRLLSRLAAQPRVHLAATADHVNAPLVWDLQTRDRFSWTWHHAPTLAPYASEVAYAAPPALLAARGGDGQQRSALIVLSSLSQNAQRVFRLMALEQLAPGGDQGAGRGGLLKGGVREEDHAGSGTRFCMCEYPGFFSPFNQVYCGYVFGNVSFC